MTILFTRAYRLVPRGKAGLACDDDGVALGPLPLVEAVSDASGGRFYSMRPAEEIEQAFHLAYGSAPDEIERYRLGLAEVTQLLAAGEDAQARIQAVLLAAPEIAPEGMAKLAQASGLRKANPDWPNQPRNPAGNPEGGQWTSGPAGEAAGANVQPAAAQTTDVQARKERFVDAHLADARKGAAQLGVPVENILGLSALESTWGQHRFAAQGNNYFGIHYPAPFATGYMLSVGGTNLATFASYADSLRSFTAISGSIIQGKQDPKAFAAALQNSGKFGIDVRTGAKLPGYVDDVAATIRGIRSIVARRRI